MTDEHIQKVTAHIPVNLLHEAQCKSSLSLQWAMETLCVIANASEASYARNPDGITLSQNVPYNN